MLSACLELSNLFRDADDSLLHDLLTFGMVGSCRARHGADQLPAGLEEFSSARLIPPIFEPIQEAVARFY